VDQHRMDYWGQYTQVLMVDCTQVCLEHMVLRPGSTLVDMDLELDVCRVEEVVDMVAVQVDWVVVLVYM